MRTPEQIARAIRQELTEFPEGWLTLEALLVRAAHEARAETATLNDHHHKTARKALDHYERYAVPRVPTRYETELAYSLAAVLGSDEGTKDE